jgi:hypothetical protein
MPGTAHKPSTLLKGGFSVPWFEEARSEKLTLLPSRQFMNGIGGGRGIRTPESLSTLTVFKTGAFNHSAIPPLTMLADASAPWPAFPACPENRCPVCCPLLDSCNLLILSVEWAGHPSVLDFAACALMAASQTRDKTAIGTGIAGLNGVKRVVLPLYNGCV